MHCSSFPNRTVCLAVWLAVFSAVGALGMPLAFGATKPASESPTEVVRTTLTEVFRILEDPTQQDRRRKLEEVIGSRFDYGEMSKRALGAQWTRLTADQRREFVELFKSFLSDRYAGRIEEYSGEQVQYLSERLEGQYAEVRTKLVSNKVEIPMDYRLITKDNRWYAYDIIADGVSLVKNYRSQFSKIIQSGSYEDLVTRLQDRTLVEDKQETR